MTKSQCAVAVSLPMPTVLLFHWAFDASKKIFVIQSTPFMDSFRFADEIVDTFHEFDKEKRFCRTISRRKHTRSLRDGHKSESYP